MKHCIKCKQPMDSYMRGYKVIYTLCMDCEMDKVFEVPMLTYTLTNQQMATLYKDVKNTIKT